VRRVKLILLFASLALAGCLGGAWLLRSDGDPPPAVQPAQTIISYSHEILPLPAPALQDLHRVCPELCVSGVA
jgi:hypothetical protein